MSGLERGPDPRDLAGQEFGMLTVLRLDRRGEDRHSYWLCRCACGTETVVRGNKLTTGKQVSCGCYRSLPELRREARLKTSPEERARIARMGGAARSQSSGGKDDENHND